MQTTGATGRGDGPSATPRHRRHLIPLRTVHSFQTIWVAGVHLRSFAHTPTVAAQRCRDARGALRDPIGAGEHVSRASCS
ncbi:MAG: hypothetical protein FAZ92_01906 [Accumulibacter sp.]|nr:MAG: hypothetical protein FAZ92_01906 [Accumulibacter sp.]